MTAWVALLRAVNVGGTGRLAMSELKAMCEQLGFAQVKTYIASGNVVFASRKSEAAIKSALAKRLASYAGKPVGIVVRNAADIAEVAASNPFAKLAPNRTVAVFLDRPPASDALKDIRGQSNEKIRLGRREIYIHYVDGIGQSKLVIPGATDGTARNMTTVARLATMAAAI